MEQFLKLLQQRRSCRRFASQPLEEKTLAAILSAGTWAPSAGNVQPWQFYVVRDDYLKQKLVQSALGQSFIAQAPVVVVVCADVQRARASYKQRGAELYCLQDTAAACQNMLLAAQALGVGSCWVGAFDERTVAQLLGVLPAHRPVALLCFGKPAEVARNPGRRSLAEVVVEVD